MAFVFAAANGSFVKIADYLNGMFVAALGSALEAFDGAQEGTLAGFIGAFADCVGYLVGGQGRTAGIAVGNADIGIQYGFGFFGTQSGIGFAHITVDLALIIDFSDLTDGSAG